MIGDINDILHMEGSSELNAAIVEMLKREIVEKPLSEMLDVDRFPLSMEQYETLMSSIDDDNISWDNVKLMFRIGLYVNYEEREEVARYITDNYCDWIRGHGGLERLIPRSYWRTRF